MGDIAIESGNFLWMVAGAYGVYRILAWKRQNHLSAYVNQIICAWTWIFISSACNAGWFAMSRHLSEEGELWHQGMFEWRWLMVSLTAIGFAYGMFRFVQLIDDFDDSKFYALFAASIAVSFLIGFY